MHVAPGALLNNFEAQHRVFSNYWPLADANSFRALNVKDNVKAAAA
jgi:hypothetical protein